MKLSVGDYDDGDYDKKSIPYNVVTYEYKKDILKNRIRALLREKEKIDYELDILYNEYTNCIFGDDKE